MNILLGVLALGVVIAWHEMAHLLAAVLLKAKVLAYAIGMGPTIWSRKFLGIDWRLGALPIGGYVSFLPVWENTDLSTVEDTEEDLESHPGALPAWRRIVIAAAGPIGSFILPLFCLTLLAFQEGVPVIAVPIQIMGITQSGAGEKAGLKVGDIITNKEFVDNAKANSGDASKVFAASAGRKVVFHILRDGQNMDIPVQLSNEAPVLGATVAYSSRPATIMEATALGINGSVRLMKNLGTGTWEALFGASKSGFFDNAAGPVGMVTGTARVMSEGASFWFVVAVISIALGFMNLIPIPALDGGQIVLLLFGQLFGMKRTSKLRSGAVLVSFAALALLTVYITWNDIAKILR